MTPLLRASDWLDFLHRGGNVAHFWCADPQPTSTWFTNTPATRLAAWQEAQAVNHEQYVSINPSTRIPPTNASGNTDPRRISKQIAYIQLINVLHTEFDGKDWVTDTDIEEMLPRFYYAYGDNPKYQEEIRRETKSNFFYDNVTAYKNMASAHIADLPYRPTLIVDSGGGYHCYWYLTEPQFITDSNRQSIIDTQHWFVLMNGGDKGVSDIARVYRVLGTRNCKPGWKGKNPLVQAISYDSNLLYDYRLLSEAARDWRRTSTRMENTQRIWSKAPRMTGGTVREQFNSSVDLVALLMAHGYRVKYRAGALARMVRPGGDKPSITVLPAAAKRPAVAVAHNTGDALYRDGRGHDAYSVMLTLEHGGDWKEAFVAAKKQVGLWEETSKPRQNRPSIAPWMVAA